MKWRSILDPATYQVTLKTSMIGMFIAPFVAVLLAVMLRKLGYFVSFNLYSICMKAEFLGFFFVTSLPISSRPLYLWFIKILILSGIYRYIMRPVLFIFGSSLE
jgi:hypothetical protein